MRYLVHTDIEIRGYFEYKDEFLIRPVLPPDIDVEELLPHLNYPYKACLIEHNYSFEDKETTNFLGIKCKDGTYAKSLENKKLYEITKLLSVFTYVCFYAEVRNDSCFKPTIIKNEANIDFKNKYSEIQTYNISDYYQLRELPNTPLAFPKQLSILFDMYYLLPEETKSRYYMACNLFHQGCRLFNDFPSMSYTAFISSLETLCSYDNNDKRYNVTSNFKKFINKYYLSASGETNFHKMAEEIYDKRSRILHNGFLHISDEDEYFYLSDNDEIEREFKKRRMIINLCRVCLVNWLIRYKI